MKKSTKIKFGGNMKLGGGLINQAPTWSGPEDKITLRELRKNSNKLRRVGLDWYNKTNGTNFKIPEKKDNNIFSGEVDASGNKKIDGPKAIKNYGLTTLDHTYDSFIDYSTGYYKLEYNGQTTRKIKHYCTADDIQYVIDQDIGTDLVKVSTIGDSNHPAFGPYYFQFNSVGEKDFIKISDQNDVNKISGFITGYKGDLNSQSAQTLEFSVNENEGAQSFSTEYTRLDPEERYFTQYTVCTKNLKVNTQIYSGHLLSPAVIKESADHTETLNLTSNDREIKYVQYVKLNKLENEIVPLLSGADIHKDLDSSIKITGWETGVSIVPERQREVARMPVKLLEPEGGYDNTYHFAGAPYYFTGIKDHIDYSEINISKSNDIKGFFINNGECGNSTSFCRKITMTGNPNLSHFHARQDWINNVREINLSGSYITGFNSNTNVTSFPELLTDHNFGWGTTYPHSPIALGMVTGLNLNGNGLNSTGIFNILAPICKNKLRNGYIDFRNQNPPIGIGVPVGIATGAINLLSGRGWTIDYDK